MAFTRAPSCPKFPAAWTDAVAAAAMAHTIDLYPNEAAGIVKDGAYERLDNVSTTPTDDVALSDDDLLRVADADVFFHSHPHGPACPSEGDMLYQIQLGIPFVILPWPAGGFFCWGDMLEGAPLVGRAFRHGIHDCYSVVRDWYWLKREIVLPNGARGWEWWKKGQRIYEDGLESAGFERIDIGAATEPGDVVLFNFGHPTPMHAAVVETRDLLLHHTSGETPYDPTRISCLVPRVRWARHITHAARFNPAKVRP